MSQNWIGESLGGRYQIEALLGQGGMSAVYRATDPNLRRTVAVKLIHSHLSEVPSFVDRFKEEAAAVARLRHPNIVQVFDFDVDEDVYYMVLEYLQGETLQERLKTLNAQHRPMSLEAVVDYGLQLCDAVGYAHRQDLIHRDIKPANIMLNPQGQAVLMDFGIVKIIGGDYHTATGSTVGTAMYMSPEQIRSEEADERSDIYSLGVTLYEMISGRAPFQADSVLTVMMMVLNDPLPDLRESRRSAPEALVVAVEKALTKDSQERFQSMGEMAEALRQAWEALSTKTAAITVVDQDLVDEQPPTASPADAPTVMDDGQSPGKEEVDAAWHPQKPEIALASEAELVGTAPASLDAPTKASAVPLPATTPREGILSSSRVRLYLFAAVLLTLVGTPLVVGLRAQMAPTLDLTAIQGSLAPINAQTAPYVVSLGRWESGLYVEDLAISPDGSRVGTAQNRERPPFYRYRYYGGLWWLENASLDRTLLGHKKWVNSVAFSPDGEILASASDDESVLLWRVSDGREAGRMEASTGGLTAVDFAPNNRLLAAGAWDSTVRLWQLSDGQLLRTLEGHEDSVLDVAFSPDGTLIASSGDDRSIRIWQVSDGQVLETLNAHTARVSSIAFSPDGAWLASASDDMSVGLWDLEDVRHVSSLQGHSEPVADVTFSPDASLLASASADGTVRLWRVSDGVQLKLLAEHDESVTSLAFSPDGRILISGAADGVLRFWGLSEAIQVE